MIKEAIEYHVKLFRLYVKNTLHKEKFSLHLHCKKSR